MSNTMMGFKVWICVEQYNEETDQHQDLDLPFASVCEFDTAGEAETFASALQQQGEELACQGHYFSREALADYRHLADGLSEMVEAGNCSSLQEDDYRWLVQTLVQITATDPEHDI
jgi:hypothetical protein